MLRLRKDDGVPLFTYFVSLFVNFALFVSWILTTRPIQITENCEET